MDMNMNMHMDMHMPMPMHMNMNMKHTGQPPCDGGCANARCRRTATEPTPAAQTA